MPGQPSSFIVLPVKHNYTSPDFLLHSAWCQLPEAIRWKGELKPLNMKSLPVPSALGSYGREASDSSASGKVRGINSMTFCTMYLGVAWSINVPASSSVRCG